VEWDVSSPRLSDVILENETYADPESFSGVRR